MTEMELYKRWSSMELEDPDLTKELKDIQNAPEEIHDRFYRELEFGTAGLRGVIGAGVNRMNIYTVRIMSTKNTSSPRLPSPMIAASSPTCSRGNRRRCWRPTGYMSTCIPS